MNAKRIYDDDGRVRFDGKIYSFSKLPLCIDGDNGVRYQTISAADNVYRVVKFKHFFLDNAFHHTEIEVV